jgi:hypothetical protein
MKPGTYKLSFDTEAYWKKRGQESFYPYVEVRVIGGGRLAALTHCPAGQVLLARPHLSDKQTGPTSGQAG